MGPVMGPHARTDRTRDMGRGTLAARSRGRAAEGGTAPDTRPPSQRWKAPPQGRPSAAPTASNAGPQGRTLWGRC